MVDWINISQNSGSGDATITVTASSYSQLLERSTALTVRTATKSAVVTIGQRYNNTFNVAPSNISGIPYTGNTYAIGISSNVSWSVTSAPNWVSFSSSSGSGNATINMVVSSNSGNARNGEVVFTNANGLVRAVSVAQVANEAQAITISMSPSSLSIPSSGGSASFVVSCNGEWTLTAPSWITLSLNAGGSGTTTVYYNCNSNTSADRSGNIVGTTSNSNSTIPVIQAGHYVGGDGSLSPSALTFPFYATSATIYVTSNVSWSLSVNDNFLSLSSYNGMSGTSIPVTVTVEQNDYSSARTASITLINQSNNEVFDSVIVSQAMHETPYITLANNRVRFPSTGGTVYIPYTSNVVPTVVLGTGYAGNPSATVDAENSRIIITSTGNTIGASFNSVQTGDFYVQFNGRTYDYIMHSTEITCQDVLTTTTTYNNNSTGKMLLFYANLSTLNSVTIDGNQINIDDLEFEFGWTDYYAVSYSFNTTGEHTVVTTAIVPQKHFEISTLKTTSLSGSYLSYNNYTDDYGGCSNLTGFTINITDTSCTDKRHYTVFPSLWNTNNLNSITILQYADTAVGFDGTNITTIYSYATPAPSVSAFANMQTSGTLHAPSGSDYSSWASALPSGWNIVYDL